MIELENLFGRQNFTKYVYNLLSNKLRNHFPEIETRIEYHVNAPKKNEVLVDFPPSRIDIMKKEKNREIKLLNLEELRLGLDQSKFPLGDYNYIINFIKILIQSKNMQIQILSLKCLRNLIVGLKEKFPDPLSFFHVCISQYSNHS